MPSRATMWTGLPSSVHSARTNGVDLDNKYPVLPQILQDNGYKTISVGKIHLKAWHMSKERGNKNITEYDPALLPECETVWNENKCNKLPDNYFGLEVTHFLGGHGSYCFGEYVQWLQSVRPDLSLIHICPPVVLINPVTIQSLRHLLLIFSIPPGIK